MVQTIQSFIKDTTHFLNILQQLGQLPNNAILVTTLNNFTFNDKHYLQIHETAMGTRMAPSYANLFLAKFDTDALLRAPLYNTYILFDGFTYNTRGYFASCVVFFRAPKGLGKILRNSQQLCPRLPHSVDSRFGLYHVAVVLSFLRSPALQKFESFIFWLIRSFTDPAYTCSIFVVRFLAYSLLITSQASSLKITNLV